MSEKEKYGIPQSDLQQIVTILQNNPKIKEAILFGSRAKGNFESGSDIDIALKGIDLSLEDILNAKTEIEELFLPWKVDLVNYHRIKENELIEHIARVGISLL